MVAESENPVPEKVTSSPPRTDPNLGEMDSSSGVDEAATLIGFVEYSTSSTKTETPQSYESLSLSIARTPCASISPILHPPATAL